MDQAWRDMVKAVVGKAGEELWEAVERYLKIPRYPWLPRDLGLDLTPIVWSWERWRVIWPVRHGPTVVTFWFEGTGAFAHIILAPRNSLKREMGWQKLLEEEGPMDYGPYNAVNDSVWTPESPVPRNPIPILHQFGNRQYQPRWVVWLLDLYSEITGRFQKAIHRTERYVENLLLQEGEAVYRVLDQVNRKNFPKPREWPALVDEAMKEAQRALEEIARRCGKVRRGNLQEKGKGLDLFPVHEYHPRRVAGLLNLYEEVIHGLKEVTHLQEKERGKGS